MSISALSFSPASWIGKLSNASTKPAFDLQSNSEDSAPTASSGTIKLESTKEDAAAEFLKWAKMNPIERMRAKYLKDHNLSEEDLAAKSPEDRQKIEDDIKKYIERVLNDKTKQKALGNITIDV